ncbi:MAG TPA: tyrosine-type recombinase/integrase [Vicinamibacterales bacterium]|nr:tyrosine-type recombinase/integrase [Vicinamibacterales bacterium]
MPFPRAARHATILRAHGIEPRIEAQTAGRRLTEDCRNALQSIDLHWHDLRHEYASRLVERGVPLSQVRDLLGHASIVTTERYDNQRPDALFEVARRLEAGESFKNLSSSGADASGTEGETVDENRGNVLNRLKKEIGVSDGI